MREMFYSFWKIIRKNIVSIIIFEIAYRTATFLVVGKLVQAAVDFSLKRQGFSYLTPENYVKFISHPISIMLIVGVLIFILCFVLIELSSLLVCYQYSFHNEKVSISTMFFEGMKRSWEFLKNSKISWLFCVAAAVPFLELFLLAREISYVKLLSYTAQLVYEAVPSFWMIIAAIILILLASMAMMFALPYCLLEKDKSIRGMKDEIRVFTGQFFKVIVGFCLIIFLSVILTAALYLLAMTGIVCYALVAKSSSLAVTTVFTYSAWVDMGAGVAAGSVELILGLAFVYSVYVRHHAKHDPKSIAAHTLTKQGSWKNRSWKSRFVGIFMCGILLAEIIYVWSLAAGRLTFAEDMLTSTSVTAHRGAALMAPENTLSALSYAIDSQSDYAEIDVQETKDKELVLLHDTSLKRTAGLGKKVWEVPYAQIRQLDAGISFNKKFRGEIIPTLEEAVKFCKGKLDLNIEIKYNGKNKGIVNKVVRVIEANDFINQCVISSMDYQFLKQVKEANPKIRTGYIMSMRYGSISRIEYADFFSVKSNYIDESFVNEAHSFGKEVHAWTVNYPGTVKKMMECKVDNIITDDPVLVRKVLNGENSTKTGFLELMKYALR